MKSDDLGIITIHCFQSSLNLDTTMLSAFLNENTFVKENTNVPMGFPTHVD